MKWMHTTHSIGVYRRSSAAALLLLITACAEMQWSKDGTGPDDRERDLAACRGQAQSQAERQSVPHPGGPRIVGVDRLGRPIVSQPEQLDGERFMAERDLTRHCMGRKGYRLVPVEQR
jgi:hypothetical protein